MRKISRLENLLLGNGLIQEIRNQNSFFNNCEDSHYLDFYKTLSRISIMAQIATTLGISYILYKNQFRSEIPSLFVLTAVKGIMYRISRNIISEIDEERKVLLEKLEVQELERDTEGEEWEIGTDYSDDI
jgi:hypothetical protein